MATSTARVRSNHRVLTATALRTRIKSALQLSIFDYALSLGGLVLLTTDVFRSGLGTVEVVHGDVAYVEPDRLMYFGPYNYDVIEVSANYSEVTPSYIATADASVWSYKYDSVSSGMRALAEVLNVSAYPVCLRYREECVNPTNLPLSTTFTMIDKLIDAIHHGVQLNRGAPLLFTTKILWIDRLHQYLVQRFWQQTQTWMHRAHYFAPGDPQLLTLCRPPLRHRRQPDYQLPAFCSLTFVWKCTESDVSVYPIWNHIAYRMQTFKQRYPDLTVDLTIITNERLGTNRYAASQLPLLRGFLREWGLEVTSWIRGRRCTTDDSVQQCKTVVVNDYRYEAATIEHNTREWRRVTGVLRAFAQLYVILRIGLHYVGAVIVHQTEHSDSARWKRCAIDAWKTFLIIPPQVLVYGNVLPVVANAIAHVIDCSNVHILGETMWESLDGAATFDIWTHIRTTTILMRNTWVLVLALQLAIVVQTAWWRSISWHPSLGIRGVRETVIGTVSALTIFGQARKVGFRNSNVVEIHMLPRAVVSPFVTGLVDGYGLSAGFFFDVKILALSSFAVVGYTLTTKLIVTVLSRCTGTKRSLFILDAFYPRSAFIPLSTGSLYSTLSLTVHWEVPRLNNLAQKKVKQNATAPSATQVVASRSRAERRLGCGNCRRGQGCLEHERIYDLANRSEDIKSIMHIFNLAMMTDPLVLLQLCHFGRSLHTIEMRDVQRNRVYVLIPYTWDDYVENHTGNADRGDVYEVVSSADISWKKLVTCG